MKKILFAAYSLDVGGIETALINLVKELKDDYKITREILYLFGLFIFVSLCHILFYKKYLNNSEVEN